MMGKYTEKINNYTAGEALLKYRRVKVKSGTAVDPVQVVYADEAEQAIGVVERDASSGDIVAVRFVDYGGSLEGVALTALTRGATLYAADNGLIDDTSSGSAIGISLEAATASGDIIEYAPFGVLSTTAATVSITDSGTFTLTATVEAALQEIYQDIKSVQQFIPISIMSFRETVNFDVGNGAANGGVLASDTTPILEAINAATDGCQRINWASGDVTQITTQIPLPPNLDVTKDLVLHVRIASEGTTDAVGFSVDSFFNEADGKVTDTTTTNQTATYAEKVATIGAADVPSGAQVLTIGLTPVAHTTDKMFFTGAWLEYAAIIRTS
jgi:hypothetical protein